jgi:hypothetical protein
MVTGSPKYTDEFSYHYLLEGIHCLTFQKNSIKALSQCFECLDTVISRAPINKPLLLLLDIRHSGIPDSKAFWQFSRRLVERRPYHPPLFSAIVHNQPALLDLFMLALDHLVLYGATIRYFSEDKQHQAIAWLLEQSDQSRQHQ